MKIFSLEKARVIEIDTKLSVSEVESAMRNYFSRPRDRTDSYVVGQMTSSGFHLMRTQRIGNSDLRPQLTAQILAQPMGARLLVEFGLSKKARAFRNCWFAGDLVITVGSAVSVAVSGIPGLWIIPLTGVLFFPLGIWFFRHSQTYYKKDVLWLTRVVCDELKGVVRKEA